MKVMAWDQGTKDRVVQNIIVGVEITVLNPSGVPASICLQ